MIDKEKVKDILYNVYNEYENELSEYESKYKKDLTTRDFAIMFELLERYMGKVNLLIDEE